VHIIKAYISTDHTAIYTLILDKYQWSIPRLIYPWQPKKIEQGLVPYRSQSIMQPESCNTACLQTVHMTDIFRLSFT